MSFSSKLSGFFSADDDFDRFDEEQDEETYPERKPVETKNEGSVMELHNNRRPVEKKIMLFEPRIFSDVKAIATRLLAGQAAVVNFQRIDDEQAHRVVDFLSGVVFAVDGEIQRIGEQIFLCTPHDFEVEGSLTDTMRSGDYKYN
ncbi:cell division protein SepF [Ligilactobacillus apodemi]|uniref:Cell division protein SepF n=1 Tax=Ligilactobacillus apodemi DSM 16634 = JCM 16172 TaxID=1423724 RepID=A0A0R1TRX5_9LACO|nr:cell division protein SepF [Ligilactobacillus apodemi]KRL84144.1 hypothetical protein FC32_GL001424 [Ligilactobacillus apodemi DSM 16634 = JCM 16172]MCR1901186.1 cell division protein SepF [Ligilactobacillus apodemi]